MNKTLQELMKTESGPPVAVTIFAGEPQCGRLVSLGLPVDGKHKNGNSAPAQPIQVQTNGARKAASLDWQSVKAIHFVKDPEAERQESVRFFDSAAIPPYLWVRVGFTDGEVIEGKLDNELTLINGHYLMLYPLDDAATDDCVCIPRTSIANLQVITFRR